MRRQYSDGQTMEADMSKIQGFRSVFRDCFITVNVFFRSGLVKLLNQTFNFPEVTEDIFYEKVDPFLLHPRCFSMVDFKPGDKVEVLDSELCNVWLKATVVSVHPYSDTKYEVSTISGAENEVVGFKSIRTLSTPSTTVYQSPVKVIEVISEVPEVEVDSEALDEMYTMQAFAHGEEAAVEAAKVVEPVAPAPIVAAVVDQGPKIIDPLNRVCYMGHPVTYTNVFPIYNVRGYGSVCCNLCLDSFPIKGNKTEKVMLFHCIECDVKEKDKEYYNMCVKCCKGPAKRKPQEEFKYINSKQTCWRKMGFSGNPNIRPTGRYVEHGHVRDGILRAYSSRILTRAENVAKEVVIDLMDQDEDEVVMLLSGLSSSSEEGEKQVTTRDTTQDTKRDRQERLERRQRHRLEQLAEVEEDEEEESESLWKRLRFSKE